jgi:lipoate-protein ligase A
MHAVQRSSRSRNAVLRVFDLCGDVLALGRYHCAPEVNSAAARVQLHRRITGGRALPFGDGFVGLSLVLPHRSSFFSDDPFELAPYQVLNRYVRGILEGCRAVQLAAFYPGRDFVTVDGRILALVSFETDEAGTLLFEAIIANTRDFSLLPDFLDHADAEGVVKAEMLTPASTTCLAKELGTELALEEVAELLRRGYAKQFGLSLEPHHFAGLEARAIAGLVARESRDEGWLRQRQRRANLDRHASAWMQLGAFEADFSLEQGRFLKEVQFSGDFIANSPAIAALEQELRLCPAEWQAIDAVSSEVLARPENFVLGVGKTRAIADLLVKGLPA